MVINEFLYWHSKIIWIWTFNLALMMKKIVSLLTFSFFVSYLLFSQEQELNKVLEYQRFAKDFFIGQKFDSAASYSLKVAEIYVKQQNWLKSAMFYRRSVLCFRKASLFDSAQFYIDSAIYISRNYFSEETEEQISERIKILSSAVDVLNSYGKFKLQLIYCNEALDIANSHNFISKCKIADLYEKRSSIYTKIGLYNHALHSDKIALQYRKKSLDSNHIDISYSLNNIGVSLINLGQYDEAIKYFQNGLKIQLLNSEDSEYEIATSYNNIGYLCAEKGDYIKALEYYQKALQIWMGKLGRKSEDVAITYINIGEALYNLSEHKNALKSYKKAYEIRRNLFGGSYYKMSNIYINIGLIYADIKDYQKALDYFKKALNLDHNLHGEIHPDIASSYDNIGNLLHNLGDTVNSLEYFFKSLQIRQSLYKDKHPDLAISYFNIGNLYFKLHNYPKALRLYQMALLSNLPNFNDSIAYNNPTEINALSKLNLLVTLNGKAEAFFLKYLQQSLEPRDIKTSISTYNLLFQLINEMRNDFSYENTSLLLSEKTKNYFGGALLAAMSYDSLKSNSKIPEKTFEYFEKSKSVTLNAYLNDLRVKSYLGIADSLVEREKEIAINRRYYETKIQQAKAEKDGYDTLLVQEYQDELFNFSRQYDSLLVVLKDNYPEYYRLKYQQNVATLEQISEQLDKNSALVNYFVADTSLFILVVSKSAQVCKRIQIDSSFNQKVIDYYIDIKSGFGVKEQLASAELYNYLISPIEQIIGDKNNLIILPDGHLNYLPFETLCKNSNDKRNQSSTDYLLNNYAITYHQSATLWLNSKITNKKGRASEKSFAGFAPVFNPEINNGTILSTNWIADTAGKEHATRAISSDAKHFNPLPWSETEIKSIVQLFEKNKSRSVAYFHRQATEDNFKQQIKDVKYIHVASHSFANDKFPSLSGIAFSQPDTSNNSKNADDGILYASETYNLDLSNAELLVLSSCKSGLGKLVQGEGFLSLSRGFLYSGVPNIVFSLWNVNDQATKDLMVEFYKQILKGKPYSIALQKAKLKLLHNRQTTEPKYWAAWKLNGSN